MRSDENSCYARPDSTTRPGTPSATPGTRSARWRGERAGVPLIGLRLSRGVARERQSAGRFRRPSTCPAGAVVLVSRRRCVPGGGFNIAKADCLAVAAVWEPQSVRLVFGLSGHWSNALNRAAVRCLPAVQHLEALSGSFSNNRTQTPDPKRSLGLWKTGPLTLVISRRNRQAKSAGDGPLNRMFECHCVFEWHGPSPMTARIARGVVPTECGVALLRRDSRSA